MVNNYINCIRIIINTYTNKIFCTMTRVDKRSWYTSIKIDIINYLWYHFEVLYNVGVDTLACINLTS